MATIWEKQLRDLGIRVFDQASEYLVDAEDAFGGSLAKLAKKWKKMPADEKDMVAEGVVGIAGALIAGIAAATQASDKKTRRKAMKKAGRKTVKKIAKAAGVPMKKAKKK
jgi:hypothetical protein